MKKLAILSPLVLLATTALAQDSTCILQPSCSQLGYTSAEADCGTAKVLRCPFDVSQVACLSGGSDSSGGGSGDEYNPNDPNNELGDAIVITINVTTAGTVKFNFGEGNIYADCGNGIISSAGTDSTSTVSCSYTNAGDYTVTLSGDFTYYGGINSGGTTKNLIKLDKSGITKMSNICDANTVGIVPPLPISLKDGTNMLNSCSKLSSAFPKLPEGLEIGNYMFSKSSISGIAKLPSSLKSAIQMFSNLKTNFTVTGFENTQVTDGTKMFAGSNIQTVNLPSTLINGTDMFASSTIKTITLPASLEIAYRMFQSTSSLEDVKGLENTKITEAVNMFYKSTVSSISGLPAKLTNGKCMFYNTKLATLPTLPNGLVDASGMFFQPGGAANISDLIGTIGPSYFPSTLTKAPGMFRSNHNLNGSPNKPSNLSDYGGIFADTAVTPTYQWDSTATNISYGNVCTSTDPNNS